MFGTKKQIEGPGAGPGGDGGKPTKKIYEDAANWEASRAVQLERSERRAWRVAGASVCVTVLALASIVVMLPLKRVDGFLVREDKTSGAIEIVGSIDNQSITFDEARDQYWLKEYVLARENYDWATLQKDYNLVGLLSNPNVGASYAGLFQGDNALDKKYGAQVQARVHIISVVPNGRGTATVRFTRTVKRVDDPTNGGTTTNWIATFGYEYLGTKRMSSSARLANPFGFQVTSYRVDPEHAGGTQ